MNVVGSEQQNSPSRFLDLLWYQVVPTAWTAKSRTVQASFLGLLWCQQRGQSDIAQQKCPSKIFRSTVVLAVRMHLLYRQLKLPNLDLLHDVCSEQLK